MNHRRNLVRDLVKENEKLLPKWFRDGEPKPFALQEVFWSSTAELMAAEVLARKPPTRIRAGRDQLVLDVPPPFWDELRRELGLLDPKVKRRTAEILRMWLLEQPTQRASTEIRLTEPLPLALVLMTGVLERLGRNGIPLSFVFDLSEFERVAYDDLAWVEVGEVNAAALARQLLRCAFTQLGHNPNLLEIPYRSYWRKLARRLDLQGYQTSPSHSVHLPENFLVEGLRTAPEPPEPSPPAAAPTPRPRDEELGELYSRLDEMQRSSPARLLPQMLGPLLIAPDDPVEALENAAASADGLARDLTLACRTLLRSGAVELIGSPGDLVELSLPCRDFQLEGAAVASGRDMSRGRFRVRRRGIRYLETVVLPAKVSPLF
ncbi:MAG: hypothetical protein GY835_02500 [bacterium]|nr:hypothetical protein [bacterium]